MFNDPKLKNQYDISLVISDFECSPDEITKELGIIPTSTTVKGEYRYSGNGEHRVKLLNHRNLWELKSNLPLNTSIEEHIKWLIKEIISQKEIIKSLSKKYRIELSCGIYYYEVNPEIILEPQLLNDIAALNISIYFDIFCLTGTNLELEEPEVVDHLSKHLTGIEFLKKYNTNAHNELITLVKSLKSIEESAYEIKGANIKDLIWNEQPSDEDVLPVFNKLVENLQNIINSINNSRYLSENVNQNIKIKLE